MRLSRLIWLGTGGGRRRFLEKTQEYRHNAVELFESIHEVTGCRVIVDSSKSPARALTLAASDQIELYIVNLFRDPRGVAYSWEKDVAADPVFSEHRLPRYRILSSTARWILSHRAGEDFLAEAPNYMS